MAFEAMNGGAGPGELLGGVLAEDGGDSKCYTRKAEDSPTLVRPPPENRRSRAGAPTDLPWQCQPAKAVRFVVVASSGRKIGIEKRLHLEAALEHEGVANTSVSPGAAARHRQQWVSMRDK
jgi:hypothetical protein